MIERQTYYFDGPGKGNTETVLRVVKGRLAEGDIGTVVVATTTGGTALKASELLGDDTELVAICFQPHHRTGDGKPFPGPEAELVERGKGAGIKFSIDAGPTRFLRETSPHIPETLRLFGQGVKVAVEVAVMAVDAGLIETGTKVIGVGGSTTGADAAVVVTAAGTADLGDVWVHEVLAKPIVRK